MRNLFDWSRHCLKNRILSPHKILSLHTHTVPGWKDRILYKSVFPEFRFLWQKRNSQKNSEDSWCSEHLIFEKKDREKQGERVRGVIIHIFLESVFPCVRREGIKNREWIFVVRCIFFFSFGSFTSSFVKSSMKVAPAEPAMKEKSRNLDIPGSTCFLFPVWIYRSSPPFFLDSSSFEHTHTRTTLDSWWDKIGG